MIWPRSCAVQGEGVIDRCNQEQGALRSDRADSAVDLSQFLPLPGAKVTTCATKCKELLKVTAEYKADVFVLN
jgi:hypothetical protein